MAAKIFNADRRTDMTKLIVAFRNIANAPKNAVAALDTIFWFSWAQLRIMVTMYSRSETETLKLIFADDTYFSYTSKVLFVRKYCTFKRHVCTVQMMTVKCNIYWFSVFRSSRSGVFKLFSHISLSQSKRVCVQLLLLLSMALQPGVGLGLLREFPPSFPVPGGYCPISTS